MANTFNNAVVPNIGTSLTTVYTCPGATTSTVIGLSIANTLVTGGSVLVDVKIFKSGGATSSYIVRGAEVPLGGSLVAIGGDQKLVLKIGDYIQVKSDQAVSIDSVISVLEIS